MEQVRTLKAEEIEVRISQVTQYGAIALLYKTARTDMDILDETFGPENWKNEYTEIKGNLYATISVLTANGWVGKTDCGVESRDDGNGNEKKGEASDAFKRAGFRWGIGRELYTAPFISLELPRHKDDRGKWVLDKLPYLDVTEIEYDERRHISRIVICDSKTRQAVYTFPKGSAPKKPIPGDPVQELTADNEVNRSRLRSAVLSMAGDLKRADAVARLKYKKTFSEMNVAELQDMKLTYIAMRDGGVNGER